jgi:hypothetical protein
LPREFNTNKNSTDPVTLQETPTYDTGEEEKKFIVPGEEENSPEYDEPSGGDTKDLDQHIKATMLDHPDGSVRLRHLETRIRAVLENLLVDEERDTLTFTQKALFEGGISIADRSDQLFILGDIDQTEEDEGVVLTAPSLDDADPIFVIQDSDGDQVLRVEKGGILATENVRMEIGYDGSAEASLDTDTALYFSAHERIESEPSTYTLRARSNYGYLNLTPRNSSGTHLYTNKNILYLGVANNAGWYINASDSYRLKGYQSTCDLISYRHNYCGNTGYWHASDGRLKKWYSGSAPSAGLGTSGNDRTDHRMKFYDTTWERNTYASGGAW